MEASALEQVTVTATEETCLDRLTDEGRALSGKQACVGCLTGDARDRWAEQQSRVVPGRVGRLYVLLRLGGVILQRAG
ncbi:hypothetical protein KYY02_22285 [Streptomyces pimonensis]|uniref:Uncharacterized protein n=1 Tax=Streptomyces pimonensis TaxID=2860288 RepID=A0ABV4J6S7_9ACTN